MRYKAAVIKSPAYQAVTQDVKSGRLSHAYLVLSPDRGIIKLFNTLVSCLIMCNNSGCGDCDTCRKIKNGNHADIMHLVPPEGKGLKVSDIEGMINSMYLAPVEPTGKKLYFLYDGDIMNASAQNKLLKTLEEPPEGVTIFISASSEAGVLDTVKSRSRKLNIDHLDVEELYKELSAYYGVGERVMNACSFSGGNAGLAEKLIYDNAYIECAEGAWELLTGLNSSKGIADYLNKPYMGKDKLSDTLTSMETILRDALAKVSGGKVWSVGKDKELEIISSRYSDAALACALEKLTEARQKLQSNCNASNVADALMFNILEVRYRCRKS